MKSLKHIRVILSLIFLGEAVAFVVLGASAPGHSAIAFRLQIIPSMILSTMGATLTWIVATLMLGRVFCSSICPIGTCQDIASHLYRKLSKKKRTYRFKSPRKIRYHILLLYILLTVIAASFGALLEPWNWFSGIAGSFSPAHDSGIFARVTGSATIGILIALLALVILLVYAFLTGRDFCNHICPIGTALGLISTRSALHIELDPDRCISCLKCEDECKSSCISIKDRIVDNTRCVRCFNCIEVCPNNAIRFQVNQNGVISPMMRRAANTSPNV